MYEYLEFWKKGFNITRKTDSDEYWKVWLIHLLIFVIPFPILFFDMIDIYWYIVGGYFAVAFIPIISITLRRFNDNEVSRMNIFWILIPVVGIFLVLAKMQYGVNDSKVDIAQVYNEKIENEHDPKKRILSEAHERQF